MRGRLLFVLTAAAVVACGAFGASSDADDDHGTPAAVDAGTSEAGPNVVTEAGSTEHEASVVELDAAANDFRAEVSALPNLVGYWRLDDVTNVGPRDTSGTYVAGTKVGAPASVESLLSNDTNAAGSFHNSALGFDGSGHALGLVGSTVTIGVIAKPVTMGIDAFILFKEKEFGLGISAVNTPFFDLPDLGHRFYAPAALAVPQNTRALLVASFDDSTSTATLWVNGIPTPGSKQRPSIGATATPFCIGGGLTGCDGYKFDGIIDEVFITKDLLSDTSVKKLTSLAGLP